MKVIEKKAADPADRAEDLIECFKIFDKVTAAHNDLPCQLPSTADPPIPRLTYHLSNISTDRTAKAIFRSQS
jgi:hypothetical protein